MSRKTSFALDIDKAGREILQSMARPVIKKSADAIASRARSMAGSISSNPPSFSVTTTVGTIKRGTRAIATVRAEGNDARSQYIGHVSLAKAKDAGRV